MPLPCSTLHITKKKKYIYEIKKHSRQKKNKKTMEVIYYFTFIINKHIAMWQPLLPADLTLLQISQANQRQCPIGK